MATASSGSLYTSFLYLCCDSVCFQAVWSDVDITCNDRTEIKGLIDKLDEADTVEYYMFEY